VVLDLVGEFVGLFGGGLLLLIVWLVWYFVVVPVVVSCFIIVGLAWWVMQVVCLVRCVSCGPGLLVGFGLCGCDCWRVCLFAGLFMWSCLYTWF